MEKFLNRLHIKGTNIQIGKANCVEFLSGDGDIREYMKTREDENLYFLAGVDKSVGKGRAKDIDVAQRRYIVIDLDIRSEVEKEGETISDDEIKRQGLMIAEDLKMKKGYDDWSYVIFSGNGVHIYYIGEAVKADSLFEAGIKQFYEKYDSFGFYLSDHTCRNASRILRLPESYNNKGEKKKVEILAEREEDARILSVVRDIGEKVIQEAKNEAKMKKIAFSVPHEGKTYDAIQSIPIADLVAKEFGWKTDGVHFTEHGSSKEKACYVPKGENFIIHSGTDHFSSTKKGYSPFEFIKEVKGLSDGDTFKFFCDNFQEIEDLDKKARKAFAKENKTEQMITAKASNETNSFTWGIDCVDETTKTLKRGKLAVMVADENQGKSTFCFFLARKNYERYGHKVIYFNLEQTKEEVYHDDAIGYAGITKIEERDEKHLTSDAYKKRIKYLEEQKYVEIIGRRAEDVMPIDDIIKRVNEIGELDLLILDNLTCIGLKDGHYNENEATKEIIQKLIGLAQKVNIPILLVHHYRKRGQSKQKSIFRDIHELSGSRVIATLASIVIQVARNFTFDDPETKSEFWIKEGKVRGGGSRDETCIYFHKGDFYKNFGGWNTADEKDFNF